MKKNLTRIISAALCLFLASPGVFAPKIAAQTPYEAHNGIRTISDCSAVTGRRATANVPDGHGFMVALTAAGSNAENITNADFDTGIFFTRAELEKGAFVIYFSHDETRLRASDGETEKTYADNVFMFIFDPLFPPHLISLFLGGFMCSQPNSFNICIIDSVFSLSLSFIFKIIIGVTS